MNAAVFAVQFVYGVQGQDMDCMQEASFARSEDQALIHMPYYVVHARQAIRDGLEYEHME